MKRRRLSRTLLVTMGCLALAATASAAVVTIFSAYVPLLDPQGTVRVERVVFRSMYAQPESTIAAATWPYRINAGPGERAGEDVNPAGMLGVKVRCDDLKTGGQVTLDLSGMKELPADVRKQWPDLSRADVLKALLVATDRNLKLVGIFDCRLVVKDAGRHADLKGMAFPKVLNPRPADRGESSEPEH